MATTDDRQELSAQAVLVRAALAMRRGGYRDRLDDHKGLAERMKKGTVSGAFHSLFTTLLPFRQLIPHEQWPLPDQSAVTFLPAISFRPQRQPFLFMPLPELLRNGFVLHDRLLGLDLLPNRKRLKERDGSIPCRLF